MQFHKLSFILIEVCTLISSANATEKYFLNKKGVVCELDFVAITEKEECWLAAKSLAINLAVKAVTSLKRPFGCSMTKKLVVFNSKTKGGIDSKTKYRTICKDALIDPRVLQLISDQNMEIKDLKIETVGLKESILMLENVFGFSVYKFAKEEKTFAEHQASAKAWGGNLTSILSQEENDFIEQRIRVTGFVEVSEIVWIGGETTFEGSWTWVDGSPFTFTNWASGQPTDLKGRDRLAFWYWSGRADKKYKWKVDHDDHHNHPAIYKKDLPGKASF